MIQPALCHLHEYEGTHVNDRDMLHEKVDFYFFYDLVRLSLKPALRLYATSQWPEVHTPTCDVLVNRQHLTEIDDSRADFDYELCEESKDFHGKYGEFVVRAESDAIGTNEMAEDTSRWNNYQDISLDKFEIGYLKDKRKRKKLGTWFPYESRGVVIHKSSLLDDDEGEGGDEDDDTIKFLVFHVSTKMKS